MTRHGRLAGSLAIMLIPVMGFIVLQGGALLGDPNGQSQVPLPPEALAACSNTLLFWPIAACAGLSAWLVRLRHARWAGMTVDEDEAAATLSAFWGEPMPTSAPLTTAEIIPAAAAPLRTPPQGDDLAARARCVALTFAFPEAAPPREASVPGGATSWPLHIACQPTRFSLTLRHAALGYRLEFGNRGAETLGPMIVRADLVTAACHDPQGERGFAGDTLPLCHYLDSLPAGDSIALTGELRLPLAGIAPVRLGTAELLVPMLRLSAESTCDARVPLRVSACFAIGLPPLAAGGGIQPFRLDTGPGTWRRLTARRQLHTDLS